MRSLFLLDCSGSNENLTLEGIFNKQADILKGGMERDHRNGVLNHGACYIAGRDAMREMHAISHAHGTEHEVSSDTQRKLVNVAAQAAVIDGYLKHTGHEAVSEDVRLSFAGAFSNSVETSGQSGIKRLRELANDPKISKAEESDLFAHIGSTGITLGTKWDITHTYYGDKEASKRQGKDNTKKTRSVRTDFKNFEVAPIEKSWHYIFPKGCVEKNEQT